MNENSLLTMENIYKSFPGVQALSDVSFDLRRGEVHCLLGENGAGKSTLIKILSGAYQMDAGRICINGKQVQIHNSHHARQLGISTIYQEMSLIPAMTVTENIFFGDELTHRFSILNKAEMEVQTKHILRKMNVDINPKSVAKDLTTAQQQMVEIARSLIKKRQFIIMDEPTSSISEKETKELFRIIKELKQQGVSILYISHRMHEFEEIVDRITILRDGRNVGTVDWKEVTLDQLITMMVGRELGDWKAASNHSREETVLQVENISSGYAVKQAGFVLKKGEIVGFAGLVGSGRTELMKSIFGARPIDSGTITWKGKPVRFRTPKDAVNQGIGYLSEDRKGEGLILHMGIDQNISLANLKAVSTRFFIHKKRERKEAASRIASLRIATDTPGKVVRHLSGGNQQKVVIAKWLLTDSDVLIFDEPTRGIDVGAKAEIYQVMEQLAASGKGIIVVSSDLPEILRISNRIIVMREGKIAGQLVNDGSVKQDHIMSLMVGG